MSSSKFNRFQQICTDLRLQTTNCPKSQVKFGEAKTIPEAVAAFRMFWVSVVEQVPAEFISILDQIYAEFREEMNAAGIYYNEAPSNPVNAITFVGDCPDEIKIMAGRPRVIVLGQADVVIGDHARCECYNECSRVICHDHSRLRLIKGSAIAKDYSLVEGNGIIETYQCSIAYIYNGALYDKGHKSIKAYNNAIIHSCSHRNIDLNDNAQLIDPELHYE